MIEIQCTSCQTRYRIDERILPEDTPTFKCSRCGHVFSAEPRQKASRRASAETARGAAIGEIRGVRTAWRCRRGCGRCRAATPVAPKPPNRRHRPSPGPPPLRRRKLRLRQR